MDRLGIGIIGYGEFAEFSHETWKQLHDVEVVAASDLDASRVPDALKYYRDYRDMLKDDSVHIVSIGTPPSTHAPMAADALRAGKHVFVEKPPAMTFQEATDLVRIARDQQRIVAVDYMLRYNPVVDALKALADSCVLGKLQHVSVANYAYDGKLPPDHWFWDKSRSGGILVEHAVHFFDMVSFIWGARPVKLSAQAHSRQPGMEDKVVATVQYDDGLIGTHYHHFFRPWWFERQSFRFAFDLGEIDVEGWIPLTAAVRAVTTEESQRRLLEIFPFADVTEERLDPQQLAQDVTYVQDAPKDLHHIRAGGHDYYADRMTHIQFAVDKPKMEVYRVCVQAAMEDLAACIRRPGHAPRIALESALDSIKIAAAGASLIAQDYGVDL